jgi:hypothetical protein
MFYFSFYSFFKNILDLNAYAISEEEQLTHEEISPV